MTTDQFDYDLPEHLIAQTPLDVRSDSRLLVLNKVTGQIQDRTFLDCLDYLEPGDVLVLNDTRVTALRLFGKKPTGGMIELLLLQESQPGQFWCLAKPGRRLQPGATVEFENGLVGQIIDANESGEKLVSFGHLQDWKEKLIEIGQVPLPPYIQSQLNDRERYQTVYSHQGGSAAAPTAGLHFTPELLKTIRSKGVEIAKVTLDVSLDTFRPVSVESIEMHQMHGETCRISPENVRLINERKGRVIAVGTTSARTLESFADSNGLLQPGEVNSKLFITPGYKFKIVDGMFTNFHMPKTTMMMMISALAGRNFVLSAYKHAVISQYRFLSFGDSMLIL